QGYAQPGRAGVQRRPRYLFRAVPVAVRLDHGQELGPFRLQYADLVADRPEVDHGDRRSVPHHLGSLERGARAAGKRASTSGATVPSPSSAPAIRPATPWT